MRRGPATRLEGGLLANVWRRLVRRRRLSPEALRVVETADRARDDQRWNLAADLYREALDQAKWHPGIWVQYGHVLKEANRLTEAETAYKTALTLRPHRAAVRVHLGHVLARRGDLEGAVEAYLTALVLEPDNLWIVDALRDVRGQGALIDMDVATRRLGLAAGEPHPLWIDARIDHIGASEVRGWVVDLRRPEVRPDISLSIDGVRIATKIERTFRRDLQDQYGGDGRVGFTLTHDGLDVPIGRHSFEILVGDQVVASRVEEGVAEISAKSTIPLEAYDRFRSSVADEAANKISEHAKISILWMPADIDALASVPNERVIVANNGNVLTADALDRISDLFSSDDAIEVVTFDEETGPDPWRPLLKGAYDRDLLLQTPYVGAAVAFKSKALMRVGLRREAAGLMAADALLRLNPPEHKVRHLSHVALIRRQPETQGSDWAACVRNAVGDDPRLSVQPHVDALGAHIAGAVRVRRSPGTATATIIVPTRDALQLLAPCVDSVLASLEHNRTAVEIVVVDHESERPETLAWLSEREAPVRVERYAGPFNWARMNNVQASKSRADVLIFLNNDTRVLTSDWIDELVSQAMRPEVGIVGTRLIYEDRTLQHAGIVARAGEAIFLSHEGVGDRGDDPGYLGRHALMHRAVAVTGAALAVRRDLFEKLGGFDERNFPVEGNDADLCMRAASRGYAVLYDPYATLYHLESKSRGFSRSGSKKAVADAAARALWERWGQAFGRDPWVSPRFASSGKPLTRLRRSGPA